MGTFRSRAGSISIFLTLCERKYPDYFDSMGRLIVDEPVVFEYLMADENQSNRSGLQAFLETLRFCRITRVALR